MQLRVAARGSKAGMSTAGIARLRAEPFGGIVATEHPPALVFVDRELMGSLGGADEHVWRERDTGLLSAPIEAHYAITRFCRVGCGSCYVSSSASPELHNGSPRGYERALAIADRLIAMKIFHVALGGGESLEIPWLFDLAAHFRRHGVVPNLTTSGHGMTAALAKKCQVFGQVNVSLDGLEEDLPPRPRGHHAHAMRAARLLRQEGLRVGINCVVTRHNFEELGAIVALARKMGLADVEFLRIKPSGRAKDHYFRLRLLPEQARELVPRLLWLGLRHRMSLKLDCSFTPFVCAHRPPTRTLEYFTILGCDAGNWLAGVDPDGRITPCSFLTEPSASLAEAAAAWRELPSFAPVRRWPDRAPEPCRSCGYVDVCKGGCRAVSHFLSGSLLDPDPECPRVASAAHR